MVVGASSRANPLRGERARFVIGNVLGDEGGEGLGEARGDFFALLPLFSSSPEFWFRTWEKERESGDDEGGVEPGGSGADLVGASTLTKISDLKFHHHFFVLFFFP